MAGSFTHQDGAHEVDDDRQARAASPRSDIDLAPAPIVASADPRRGHRASPVGLMALQRSAGNAAVASLVAPRTVQRAVEIDEMTTSVGVADAAPAPATGPGAGPAASPVTSDGATTTITGGAIHLEAPMTTSSGVLQVDTLIANSIVAASYSPGAGNVW